MEIKMKTWNNEKFRLSNHKEGHCHSEILENIKEGDEWIDGGGTLHICVWVNRDKDRDCGGMVERVEAKNDRTPHKGRRAEGFIKWKNVWERDK